MGWLGDPVPAQVDPNWRDGCMSASVNPGGGGARTGSMSLLVVVGTCGGRNNDVTARICCDTVVAASVIGCRLFASAGVSAIRSSARSISPRAAVSSSIGLLPGMCSLIGCHDKQSDVRSARVLGIHTV